jgi:hypothetical protein
MRAGQALGRIERALELDVGPMERPLVAAPAGPHRQTRLDGLLEEVEPLRKWRERQAQAGSLLGVVTGPDPEHGPTTGEHVERRDRFR